MINIGDMKSGRLDRSDPRDGETEVRPLTDDMTRKEPQQKLRWGCQYGCSNGAVDLTICR